jgi:hypothetical protein
MYKTGDLEVALIVDYDDDNAYSPGFTADTYDSRENRLELKLGDIFARLPHSCDAWIIGGREQILAMIHDLQEALKKFD